MRWFTNFFQPKEKHEFDLQSTYIVVEFLTEQEKIEKNRIVKQLKKTCEEDVQTMIPYAEAFKCSYRYTLNTAEINPNLTDKIKLQQLIALIQATTDQGLGEFLEINSQRFKLFYHNQKSIHVEDILPLYNERDISFYDPWQVLEIVYTKKSFLQRMKIKSGKFVSSIPKKLTNLFLWVIGKVLETFGIKFGKDFVMKMIPFKTVLNWLFGFLLIFFPALGPIIGISKALL